ncbi:hypothetical protein TNCV_3306711 [Trichonephila clavipes]|nr:hypothetical protein TNCV_3306711 [Trichonephila clavipes]
MSFEARNSVQLTFQQIQEVKFPTDLMGPDRYTRDFKYPHNQKSAGVKSETESHEYLQRLLDSVFPGTFVSGMP